MKTTTIKFGKYLALSFLALGLTVSSCKKEDEVEETESLPDTFTKKALIEEFTGEWCVYCPDGAEILHDMKAASPNKYVAVGVHAGDPFQLDQYSVLDGMFNITGFPSAAVVRRKFGDKYGISRSIWKSSADSDLATPASVGISIETSDDGSVTVKYGSHIDQTNLKLTVYVTEDNVPETSVGAQVGADDGYIHQDVLREVLSGSTGDDVTIAAGEIQSKTYKASLTGLDKSNTKIVAFLHKYLPSTSNLEVVNAQEVKLGSTVDY